MDAAARMYVSGATPSMIAGAIGKTPETVRQWLGGRAAQERLETIRGLVLRETATHYFEMLGMLTQVRTTLQGGLTDPDTKVRVGLAQWFHETLVPRPAQRTETEVTHHLPPEFGDALSAIADSARALAAGGNGKPLRIRTGPEALPSPLVDLTTESGDT